MVIADGGAERLIAATRACDPALSPGHQAGEPFQHPLLPASGSLRERGVR